MTISRFIVLMMLPLLLVGCASSKSSDVYSRNQAQREMQIRMGVIESIRNVTMEGTKSGAGTFAGAAVGGVAGSNVGGGKGQIVGAIVGAVVGGLAGSAIEENVTKKTAQEITVRLDSGQMIAVVQEDGERLYPGDRVRILSGSGSTRVTR